MTQPFTKAGLVLGYLGLTVVLIAAPMFLSMFAHDIQVNACTDAGGVR